MPITELPETIRRAWGHDVTQEFTTWLAEQLRTVESAAHIQISALIAQQKVKTIVLSL